MLCVMLDLVADELDRVHERIAGRFARAELRARGRRYVSGLVAGLERKNGWTLPEQAGAVCPDEMQRLLHRADWDVDGVRDDVRGHEIAGFLAYGLPPIRLIISSREMPCRSHHSWASFSSTTSGRSRNASSAACVYPNSRRRLTTR
jgi:hypothetical protein